MITTMIIMMIKIFFFLPEPCVSKYCLLASNSFIFGLYEFSAFGVSVAVSLFWSATVVVVFAVSVVDSGVSFSSGSLFASTFFTELTLPFFSALYCSISF